MKLNSLIVAASTLLLVSMMVVSANRLMTHRRPVYRHNLWCNFQTRTRLLHYSCILVTLIWTFLHIPFWKSLMCL